MRKYRGFTSGTQSEAHYVGARNGLSHSSGAERQTGGHTSGREQFAQQRRECAFRTCKLFQYGEVVAAIKTLNFSRQTIALA